MTRLLAVAALVASAAPVFGVEPVGKPVAGVGLLSTDRTLVYLPAKGGGIEAVDLATGKVIWVNKGADRLAGASGKLVFAWVGEPKKPNAFRVAAFDAATGKPVGTSEPIELPDWAVTAPDYGRSFRAAARAHGDSGAVVAWEAHAFYAGGAPPPPEVLKNAAKDAAGLVRVDFASGKVKAEAEKPKADDFDAGPALNPNVKAGDYEFRIREEYPGPKEPSFMRVTLTVLKGGKKLWARDIAGNPYLPPLP